MNAFINHFLTFTDSRDLLQIQGDSTESVNILGSDSIGHCEQKSSYEHVSISER